MSALRNIRTSLGRGWVTGLLVSVAIATGCSDGSDLTLHHPPASARNLPTAVEQVAGLPDHNIYRPADLEATGAPLPLIVWGNGGCVRYDAVWSDLLTTWASGGFVVVTHTVPASGADPTAHPTTTADLAAMIDWAAAENDRAGSPYAGRLDLDRVVAAGNSCGGIIALGLASADSRVQAVFVLSGSSVPPGASAEAAAAIMGNILVPVGYVVGGPEDIASVYAKQDYEVLPAGVPAYIAARFEGDHRTVSTEPDILRDVAAISTRWIDFALFGNPSVRRELLENPCDDCAPGTWTVEAKNLELHTPR